MYKNKKIVALIPARAGSKSIPGKNHHLLAGKPLVWWTFQAAKKCFLIDAIFCSTDDVKVTQVAHSCSIEVLSRPKHLAKDTTSMRSVLLHVLAQLKRKNVSFDYLVLLQPTSPLRTANDICKAIKKAVTQNSRSLATVTPLPLRPGLLLCGKKKQTDLRTHSLAPQYADIRRQKSPSLYYVNGAIYVWKKSLISTHIPLNAPEHGIMLAPEHTIDIDNIEDLQKCAKIMNQVKVSRKNI